MNRLEKINLFLAITQTMIAVVTFALLIAHYAPKTETEGQEGNCPTGYVYEYVFNHRSFDNDAVSKAQGAHATKEN